MHSLNGLQPEAICGYPAFPWCGKGCQLWNRCWPVKIRSCCTTYTTRWSWRLGDMFCSFLFRWKDGVRLMRFFHNTHAYTHTHANSNRPQICYSIRFVETIWVMRCIHTCTVTIGDWDVWSYDKIAKLYCLVCMWFVCRHANGPHSQVVSRMLMKDHGRSDLPGDTPKKRSGFCCMCFLIWSRWQKVPRKPCMVFNFGLEVADSPFLSLKLPSHSLETFEDLDMVVPGAWLSMFGKWLPVSWLRGQEFLAAYRQGYRVKTLHMENRWVTL